MNQQQVKESILGIFTIVNQRLFGHYKNYEEFFESMNIPKHTYSKLDEYSSNLSTKDIELFKKKLGKFLEKDYDNISTISDMVNTLDIDIILTQRQQRIYESIKKYEPIDIKTLIYMRIDKQEGLQEILDFLENNSYIMGIKTFDDEYKEYKCNPTKNVNL